MHLPMAVSSPGALVEVPAEVTELGARFAAAGHTLYLVGGSVRDALLQRGGNDYDFTTDARPHDVLALCRPVADSVWTTGIEYGTVGARIGGHPLEITTYRADRYDRISRNPEVAFGESLTDDLLRRDFTMNAMAVSMGGPDVGEFVDPFGGLADLARGELRTPGKPEDSFADDPLRMLRAARFVSQLGVSVAPEVAAAMTAMAGELGRITAERVQVELSKLLLGLHPREGLETLVSTGLADVVLPELPALAMAVDEHGQHKDVYAHTLQVLDQAIDLEIASNWPPDLVLRWAAVLHDVGKPATRRFENGGRVTFHHHEVVGARMARERLRALRYSKEIIEQVGTLVFLHLRFYGYGKGEWTDSAVRRYVTDAGDLLPRLHKLVRSDCTTRNKRKATNLAQTYDQLEDRIAALREQEELDSIRPDLDGNAIMALLGVGPGPLIGRAYKHMLAVRLEQGPLSAADAEAELRRWWAEQN